jgi:hypothetical protein
MPTVALATPPTNTADSAISPFLLVDSDSFDPGQVHTLAPRSYSRADYETAYHVWAGPAGRSIRGTAALLGVPHTTVSLWSRRFDWDTRHGDSAAQSVQAAVHQADAVTQALITAGQVPAIVALHEIIADPTHKRRDVAALAMLALGGRPLPKAPQVTATRTLSDGTSISVKMSDLSALSPAELTAYARTGILPDRASMPNPVADATEDPDSGYTDTRQHDDTTARTDE